MMFDRRGRRGDRYCRMGRPREGQVSMIYLQMGLAAERAAKKRAEAREKSQAEIEAFVEETARLAMDRRPADL